MARFGIPARAIMFSRSGQDKWAAVREMSFLDSSSRHLSSGERDILEDELVADPLTPEVSDEWSEWLDSQMDMEWRCSIRPSLLPCTLRYLKIKMSLAFKLAFKVASFSEKINSWQKLDH